MQMLQRLAMGEEAANEQPTSPNKELDERVNTNINAILDSLGQDSEGPPAGSSLPTWAAAAAKDATSAAVDAHARAVRHCQPSSKPSMSAAVDAGAELSAHSHTGSQRAEQEVVLQDAFATILRELAALRAEQQNMAVQLRNLSSASGRVGAFAV